MLYDQHLAFWITGPKRDKNKTTVCRAIFTTKPKRVCEEQQCDKNQPQPKDAIDKIREAYRQRVTQALPTIRSVLAGLANAVMGVLPVWAKSVGFELE